MNDCRRAQGGFLGATLSPNLTRQNAGSLPSGMGGVAGLDLRLCSHLLQVTAGVNERRVPTTDEDPIRLVRDYHLGADLVRRFSFRSDEFASHLTAVLGEQVGVEFGYSQAEGGGEGTGTSQSRRTYTVASVSIWRVNINLAQFTLRSRLWSDDDSLPPFAAEAVVGIGYYPEESVGPDDDIKRLQRELDTLQGSVATREQDWKKLILWDRVLDKVSLGEDLSSVVWETWASSLPDKDGVRWREFADWLKQGFLQEADVQTLAQGALTPAQLTLLSNELKAKPIVEILRSGNETAQHLTTILSRIDRATLKARIAEKIETEKVLYDQRYLSLDDQIRQKEAEIAQARSDDREAKAMFHLPMIAVTALDEIQLFETADPSRASPGLTAKVNALIVPIQGFNDFMIVRSVQAFHENADRTIATGAEIGLVLLGGSAMAYGGLKRKPGFFHAGMMVDSSIAVTIASDDYSQSTPKPALANDLRLALGLGAGTLLAFAGGITLVKQGGDSPWGWGLLTGAGGHTLGALWSWRFGP